jgi:hypothetical protein
MTKTEQLFNQLKPRYEKAYLASNGFKVDDVKYIKGFVHLYSHGSDKPMKVRLSAFEFMTKTLEERAANKK